MLMTLVVMLPARSPCPRAPRVLLCPCPPGGWAGTLTPALMMSGAQIHRVKTFPDDWCAFYTAEVALAIEHIHVSGFIYRDLKLENVLICIDGHAKLGDFGLAKQIETEIETSDLDAADADALAAGQMEGRVGTSLAMAPEMLRGEWYDNSVDWWALGVMLCEMNIGSSILPKVSESNGTTRAMVLQAFEQRKHLDTMPAYVSAAMRKCIGSLLTVSASERVRSLAALKKHALYDEVDWQALLDAKLTAPLAAHLAATEATKQNLSRTPVTGSQTSSAHSLALSSNSKASSHGSRGSSSKISDSSGGTSGIEEVERMFGAFMEEGDFDGNEDDVDCSSVALCDAASRGDTSSLRRIHAAGGDINLGDYDKRTAIHLASSDGLLAVVKLLVEELGAVHSPVDRWGAQLPPTPTPRCE